MALEHVLSVFLLLSVPLYVLVLVSVTRARAEMGTSFYAFFMSAGIADIASVTHTMFLMTLPEWFYYQQFPKTKFWATYLKMGSWYFWYAQLFSLLTVTVDRYTAIAMPIRYTQIWNRRLVITLVMLQWGVGLLFLLPMFHPALHSHYAPNSTSLWPHFDNPEISQIYFLADAIIITVLLLAFVGINFATIRKMRGFLRKKSVTGRINRGNTKKRKATVRLSLMSISLSVTFALCCFTLWGMYSTTFGVPIIAEFASQHMLFLYTAYQILSCLFQVQTPYFILVLSTPIRRAFLATIFCHKYQVTTVGSMKSGANGRHVQSMNDPPRTD